MSVVDPAKVGGQERTREAGTISLLILRLQSIALEEVEERFASPSLVQGR